MQKKKLNCSHRIEENQWKGYPFGAQTDPENLIHRFPCLLILLTCKGERPWLWGWAWIAAGNRALGGNAWRKFRCLTTVFLAWSGYSPLDGMLVYRRVTPCDKLASFADTHLHTWMKRSTVRVKCLAKEHNTMTPAKARTRTTQSGVERTNPEATAPPHMTEILTTW